MRGLFTKRTDVARAIGILSRPGHCIVGIIRIEERSRIPSDRKIRFFGVRIETVEIANRAPKDNSQTLVALMKKMGSLLISAR
jgi:hypothetical protein